MAAYYNEIEPYAAQWLRNLIKAGHIADGEVDTRSIVDVHPFDLQGFDQCHFFAGVGGWSHALRLAGWPDSRPVWTGSCPCQPFSVAGKGAGIDDPRHLWPHFHRLISAVRPPVVLGEQVAGKAGYGWFDGVRADLEGIGYAGRAVDIPALAVNAPHIRQRLYWVALDMVDTQSISNNGPLQQGQRQDIPRPVDAGGRDRSDHMGGVQRDEQWADGQVEPCSVHGHMADADEGGRGRWACDGDGERDGQAGERHEDHLDVADASSQPRQQDTRSASGDETSNGRTGRHTQQPDGHHRPSSYGKSHWDDHIWLTGSDGKARRSQPGLPLLVNGISGGISLVRARKDGAEETHTYNRVGALRAFGNAIVAPLAKEVIIALMEVLDGEQSLQEDR